MRFKVVSRNQANAAIKKFDAIVLISINNIGKRTYQSRLPAGKHYSFQFEDDEDPSTPYGPTDAALRSILAVNLPPEGNVIVNCEAGQSRSSATALALAYKQGYDMWAAKRELYEQRPIAAPNMLMMQIYDDILQADGKLFFLGQEINNNYWSERGGRFGYKGNLPRY